MAGHTFLFVVACILSVAKCGSWDGLTIQADDEAASNDEWNQLKMGNWKHFKLAKDAEDGDEVAKLHNIDYEMYVGSDEDDSEGCCCTQAPSSPTTAPAPASGKPGVANRPGQVGNGQPAPAATGRPAPAPTGRPAPAATGQPAPAATGQPAASRRRPSFAPAFSILSEFGY